MGKNLRVPTFIAIGDNGRAAGCRAVDARALYELFTTDKSQLKRRKDIEFSIRVYQGRSQLFMHDTQDADDLKCSQEALSIAAIWLELFSRDMDEDPTDGVGSGASTKASSEITSENFDSSMHYALISPGDLLNPRESIVARHIHELPDYFL